MEQFAFEYCGYELCLASFNIFSNDLEEGASSRLMTFTDDTALRNTLLKD